MNIGAFDPDIYFLFFSAIFLFFCLAYFILFVFFQYRKKQRINLHEQERLKAVFTEQLLQSQVEIQENTLEQIGQEIHDNIGQALTFVKLSINTINLDNRQQTEAKLVQSAELVSKAIQDLRNLSKILNTNFITNVGLSASIQYQLDYLQRTGAYQTALILSEDVYPIPPETEIVLFRVVQELLNNIVKHAEATTVSIRLDYQPALLTIAVNDNGKGFDLQQISNKAAAKGLGLSNMQSRLTPIQATLHLSSEPAKGTQAVITLPTSQEARCTSTPTDDSLLPATAVHHPL